MEKAAGFTQELGLLDRFIALKRAETKLEGSSEGWRQKAAADLRLIEEIAERIAKK